MFLKMGFKSYEEATGEGEFFCPCCATQRPYVILEVKEYLTAFGIPVWWAWSTSAGIACKGCDARFDLGYAKYTEADIRESMRPWTCDKCGTANEFTNAGCRQCAELRPDLAAAKKAAKPTPRWND